MGIGLPNCVTAVSAPSPPTSRGRRNPQRADSAGPGPVPPRLVCRAGVPRYGALCPRPAGQRLARVRPVRGRAAATGARLAPSRGSGASTPPRGRNDRAAAADSRHVFILMAAGNGGAEWRERSSDAGAYRASQLCRAPAPLVPQPRVECSNIGHRVLSGARVPQKARCYQAIRQHRGSIATPKCNLGAKRLYR